METAITSDGARYFPDDADMAARFDALADALGGEDLRPQHAMLIADLVRSERLKERLSADIAQRGIGGEARNGTQRYWKDNKSVTQLIKLMDQQRRTMMALGLIARESSQPRAESDGDDFDDL